MIRHLRVWLAALALLLAGPAAAQDRPSEEQLFGAPAAPAAPPEPQPSRPTPQSSPRPEEAELFGGTGSPNALPPPPVGIVPREKAETLQIGGQAYLRLATAWQQDVKPRDWALASPNLVDLYLDARPNDRVRAFVLGRMSYDPTLGTATSGLLDASAIPGVTATPSANPRGALDQLWVNFDLGRRVFVTAGKQHVKWGVGRFWNPTDYLHPVKRNPLAVFDARVGTALVKVHVPWEARGWNLYGVAMLDDVAGEDRPAGRLGRVAGGGRAEVVLGTAELGLDALAQDGHRPRFGVDLSAGIWELDLYAEAALRHGVDTPRWREVDPAAPSVIDRFRREDPRGFTPQVVLGGGWTHNYSDEDAFTLGAEYFFDDSGYDDPHIYPVLLAVPVAGQLLGDPALASQQPFTPFYLGRHYAGVFAVLPKPGPWNDTTFTLSVLGNLSDRSFVARLDHSVLALTYLRVETFVAGHLGAKGGELRLGFDVPPQPLGGGVLTPRFALPAPVLEAGVALRVGL
jgi:hypothetical protein